MHTLSHPYTANHPIERSNVSPLARFAEWCRSQEKYRLGWLATTIALHGCIITPVTLMAIIFTGNNFVFWIAAMAAMGMSLVSSLAALPVKITIPIFFLSVLIDLSVIIICLFVGFNMVS